MEYRREIDGLRAVAVLPVIFFHAGFNFFSGGYVGVDVFFVISGYLITSLIFIEWQKGQFSFARFYERRARRILPALFIVMLASIPLSLLLMTPVQLVDFSESIVSTLFFFSNFHFFIEEGYFAVASESKPLLHTWSLSIEEQFYIFFPSAFLLMLSFSRKLTVHAIVLVILLSMAFAQWSGNLISEPPFIENQFRWFDQSFLASYYMPFGRIWELLIGSLLAIYLSTRTLSENNWLQEMGAITGIVLIGVAVIEFDASTPFPSAYTLVPVLGTSLVILFATSENVAGKLLSSKLLVGFGLVSYSLYLWHQPVLAYVRLASPDWLEGLMLIPILAGCLLLSIITWKFVEAPFRNKHKLTSNGLVIWLFGAMFATVGFATTTIVKKGFIERYPSEDQKLLAINEKEMARYTPAYFKQRRFAPFEEDKYKIFVIGDSFAMDFLNMGIESGYLSSFSVSTHHIERQCGLVFSDQDLSTYIPADEKVYCERRGRFDNAHVRELIAEADMVVLAARWSDWVVSYLNETVSQISNIGGKRVIVVGSKNLGQVNVRAFLGTSLQDKVLHRSEIDDSEKGVIQKMRKNFTHLEYIDIQEIICGSYSNCPIFTPDGDLVSLDGKHLTKQGALYYGSRVFSETPFSLLL